MEYRLTGWQTVQVSAILLPILEQFLKVGLVPTFCFRQMYRQNPVLVKLLEPVVTALGYELLGIEHFPRGQGSLLRIYIDSQSGINLDDCARVSERVTGLLDVKDPIRGSYNLEVSSPGFDRPLFTPDHLKRFIGHQVRLKLHRKIAGRRRFKGEIAAVDTHCVRINVDGTDYLIPVDMIDRAHLVPGTNFKSGVI
jgi:ribosome maturation factor RimP